MNEYIANRAKGLLANLAWLDRVAGLVKTLSYTEGTTEKPKLLKMPISSDVQPELLNTAGYCALAPSSAITGLAYFENINCQVAAQVGNWLPFAAKLRLVIWVDLQKAEKSSTQAQAEVLAAIATGKIPGCGVLNNLQPKITAVLNQEQNLFNKYSYPEQVQQYLLYPYYAFAIDLDFTGRYNVLHTDTI